MSSAPRNAHAAGRAATAAEVDAISLTAAPIYAALIAPYVSTGVTTAQEATLAHLRTVACHEAMALRRAADAAAIPPTNVDVPYVSQDGDVLSCTMGNWIGEPTAYAYQWKSDATNVGTDAASYTVAAGDAGHTMTCVVTATNDFGTTAAPPSNGIDIPAAARSALHSEPGHPTKENNHGR